MASYTLGASPILALHLREPRRGLWTADVELDAASAPSGLVTLDLGGVAFVGTVWRGGLDGGRAKARIVGGRGGLGRVLDARSYHDVALAVVLADVMTESGEILGASIDLSQFVVGQWTRALGAAAESLDDVARAVAATWRLGRDGAVVLAQDTYPAAALELETAPMTKAEPHLGLATIAPPDGSLLAPATTWRGQRVELVVTRISGSSLRQEIWDA